MRFDPHAKLLWHGDRVGNWLETGKAIPVLIEISPTGYCNATCPWCFFKDRHDSERICSETMFRALSDVADLGVKAVNWTGGGEPSIHPDFGKFIKFANEKGLKQGLFTNGFRELPYQEMFEWIRISITDDGYEAIKPPKVPFGICLNQLESQSAEEITQWCLGAQNLGASYFQVRPALMGSCKVQPKLEVPVYLKQHETNDFKVYTTPYKYEESVRERDYSKCYGYFFCPSINWRGHLGVCLYLMHDERFILGDLGKERFSEIWKRIPPHIDVIPQCQNCCKNHEINRILSAAKDVEQTDFI